MTDHKSAVINLAAFLGGAAPPMPAAACKGLGLLFDPAHPGEQPPATEDRHREALALCEGCEELPPCRDWMNSLPLSKRPLGVTAGTAITEKNGKRTA